METTGGEKWKEHYHLCVLVKGFLRLCRTKWNRDPTFKNLQDLYLLIGQKFTLEWTDLTFVNSNEELGLWYLLPPVSVNASK